MTRLSQPDPIAFEPRIDGFRALPTRLALAICSMHGRWWALLYVLVPVGVLAGSLWLSPQFADGIVGICGFLALALWATAYYAYSGSRTRIDVSTQSLTVAHGHDDLFGRQERTVDLDQIDAISVHVLGETAIVRIDDHRFGLTDRLLSPTTFLVPTDRLPAALEALRAAGVTTSGGERDGDGGRTIGSTVRLVVTPLLLVGVPLVAVFVFGSSILITNGAVVVLVLGAMAIGYELRGGTPTGT